MTKKDKRVPEATTTPPALPPDAELFDVPRELLLEAQLAQANLQLAQRAIADANAAQKTAQQALLDVVTENGAYELAGDVDLATRKIPRRKRNI